MLIVVEGVDGAGKTTLITNLLRNTKRYFWTCRSTGPPRDAADLLDSVAWLSRAAYSGIPIVLDRHPLISEPIYGPLLRDKDYVLESLGEKNCKDALLDTVKHVIYCRPSKATLLREVEKEIQLEGVKERLFVITDRYDREIERLKEYGIKVTEYNWEATPLTGPEYDQLFFG